jgi:hypothetical protein
VTEAGRTPDCLHATRENGVCTQCGHCDHDLIVNGACYFCGTTEIDPIAISPKKPALIAPERLTKKH